MYKLLIEDDEGGQTAVSLIRDEITIGRKEGNTIRLTDRNVSRRHGRIVREDDRIYVEDVAARYGIKKNGNKIKDRAELKEGDVVLIGDYKLTLKLDPKAKKKKDEQQAKKTPSLPKAPEGSLANDFSDNDRDKTQVIQTLPAKLVVISSNFAGEEFPLTRDEMIIGRGEACNIIIDHRSVSAKHAKVVHEDTDAYKIVDLNSSNGVKVNGEQYRALHLKRGDVVELGHVKFRFVEPGENYVFSPQDQVDAVAAEVDSGPDLMKLGLVGGAAVAAVVVLAGMAMILFSDDGDDEPVQDQQAAVEQLHEEVDIDIEEGDDQVKAFVKNARQQIEAGNLREPVGQLETARDLLDPTPEQRQEIDDLIALARHERSNKAHYQKALDELESGELRAALDEMLAIPPNTIFRNLLEEEGVAEEILEGILAAGFEAVEQEELDRAREKAEELEVVDYEPAADLRQAILDKEEELEQQAVAMQQEDRPAPSPPSSSGSDSTQPTQTTTSPGLSAEEARAKYTEAAQNLTGGNPQATVSICRDALNAGHTPCHRLMGLAYVRLNDEASACNHFRQYLASGPSNPGPVERQMENLGCD